MSAPDWAKQAPTWKELAHRDNLDFTDAAQRAEGKDPHPQPPKRETVNEYMNRIFGRTE